MARLRGLVCWHGGDASRSMRGSHIAAGALAALLVAGATTSAPTASLDGIAPGLPSTGASLGLSVSPAQAAAADFVFPHSSYQLLTPADLNGLSSYDLYLARNEIFARHGYIFVSDDLRARFGAMPWYVPLYTEAQFSWDYLNQVEMCNIALIQEREAVLAGTVPSSSYVFPASSYELLSASDLWYCTPYDLYLARNEIFARHGYIFSNADLDAYFRAQPWYMPRYTPDAFKWEWLSSIEMRNIALIQEREELVNTALPNTFDVQTATGRVTTEYFSFAIPQQWQGYVDVTYCNEGGYPCVKVSYRDYPEMVLATVDVCDASSPLAEGDIATGLVSYWDNGRGQRIELWARNYVFLTQWAAQEGSGEYAMGVYPNEFVEAALIDLSTGGAYTVETARLSNQGSGSADGFDFYRWALAPTMWIA